MGTFSVYIEVEHPTGRNRQWVNAMVDTGSTGTLLPSDLLGLLGIEPTGEEKLRVATGAVDVCKIGEAKVRIGGRERTTRVAFGPDPSVCLLGAETLECFGLIADTTHHRLIPDKLLLSVVGIGIVAGMPYQRPA